MSETVDDLLTPSLLVDAARLRANVKRMQAACDAGGARLWPHVKTHKAVEIARMQLEAGAAGLTCAKLGEAEALLPSGVRRVFVAYPLVDARLAPRLRALAASLDELILAVTSRAQAEALEGLLSAAGLLLPVLLAVDSGLGREGARSQVAADALATFVRRSPRMRLAGLFTHEGHAYGADRDGIQDTARAALDRIQAIRDRIGDPVLPLWPGCSITAAAMASLSGVDNLRPGAYVFGDLSLTRNGLLDGDGVALSVLATVVDRPEPGLALVDAGSKVFSSDRTSEGLYGSLADGRDAHLTRLSEEHGWVTGPDADTLRVGERVRFVVAHACPAVNLADELIVVAGEDVTARWRVAARGRVQ